MLDVLGDYLPQSGETIIRASTLLDANAPSRIRSLAVVAINPLVQRGEGRRVVEITLVLMRT